MANEAVILNTDPKAGLYRGTNADGQVGIIDDRRVLETGNFIYELGFHPGILTRVCTAGAKKEDTIQSLHYKTLENGIIQHYDEVVEAQSSTTATTIKVADRHLWVPDHTWFNVDTMETVLVQSVAATSVTGYPNAGTVTIIRGYGETDFPAKAMAKGDRMQRTGPAMKEAGSSARSQKTVIQPVLNGMRRLSHTFTMSDVTAMMDGKAFYGMSERERLERDMRYQAIVNEESSLLDGQFVYDFPGKASSSEFGALIESNLDSWRGTTRGLVPTIHKFAPGNIYDCGGTLSYRLLTDFVAHLSKYNPGGMQKQIKKSGSKETSTKVKYIALCGDTAISALTDLLHNKVQTTVGASSYGFDMTRLTAPFGSIDIMRHVLLDGPRADWMVFIDPQRVGIRTFKGFNNRFVPVTLEDSYVKKWDLQKIFGFWVGNAELFGIMKNVQAAI